MNTRPINPDILPASGAILVPRDRWEDSTSPVIVDHAIPERTAVCVLPHDGDDIELAGDELLQEWREVVGDDAKALRRRYWPESLFSLMAVDNDGKTLVPAKTSLGRTFAVTLAGRGPDAALEIIAREQVNVVLVDFAADGLRVLEEIRARHPGVRRFLASETDVPRIKMYVASGLVERFFRKPVPAGQVLEYVALNIGPHGKSNGSR